MNLKRFEFDPLKPILLFIVIAAIFCFFYTDINQFIAKYTIAALVLGVAFILFVWKYARAVRLYISHEPAIVLTDEAIEMKGTNMTIYWEDVANVYINSASYDRFGKRLPWKSYHLIVKVKEPEKYIVKISNPIVRQYRWWVRSLDPGTFEADLTLVKGNEDEILQTILTRYQNERTRLTKF